MTRLATGAIALLLVQVLACEEVPIPLDPTSVDETPRESFQGPPPPSPSPASEVPPPANPDSTYAITSSPAKPFTPTNTPRPNAAPAFVAGGEQRVECPVGYKAQTAEGGCACVSSADHVSVSPFEEAPCSTAGRAEGDECLFPCGKTAAVQ